MAESKEESSSIIGPELESMIGHVKSTILSLLSEEDRSMDVLSRELGINKTAVKEHMEILENRGFVRPFFKNEGNGRPRKYYQLTEKAVELFPKRYTLLSSILVDEIEKEFGTDKLNELLGRVADRIIDSAGMTAAGGEPANREERIARLREFVAALNQLGYYAKLETDGDRARIIRRNCIFFELAKNNTRIICGSLGSQLVSKSVEDDFKIIEKFSSGDKRCVVELKI